MAGTGKPLDGQTFSKNITFRKCLETVDQAAHEDIWVTWDGADHRWSSSPSCSLDIGSSPHSAVAFLRLDSTLLRQHLHFLEEVSRRVCATVCCRHCGTVGKRRGEPPLPPPPAAEKPDRQRAGKCRHTEQTPPSYCREKLLIALLCRGSTEAERLLGRGVNLGVLGVRGGCGVGNQGPVHSHTLGWKKQ